MSSDTCATLADTALETNKVTSNEVRLPRPSRGVATRVTRYREDYSVILHPDDFRQFEALDELVSEACRLDRLLPSDVGARVHLEDRPSEPIEDAATLKRLFG
jgi:hypothetical protein